MLQRLELLRRGARPESSRSWSRAARWRTWSTSCSALASSRVRSLSSVCGRDELVAQPCSSLLELGELGVLGQRARLCASWSSRVSWAWTSSRRPGRVGCVTTVAGLRSVGRGSPDDPTRLGTRKVHGSVRAWRHVHSTVGAGARRSAPSSRSPARPPGPLAGPVRGVDQAGRRPPASRELGGRVVAQVGGDVGVDAAAGRRRAACRPAPPHTATRRTGGRVAGDADALRGGRQRRGDQLGESRSVVGRGQPPTRPMPRAAGTDGQLVAGRRPAPRTGAPSAARPRRRAPRPRAAPSRPGVSVARPAALAVVGLRPAPRRERAGAGHRPGAARRSRRPRRPRPRRARPPAARRPARGRR